MNSPMEAAHQATQSAQAALRGIADATANTLSDLVDDVHMRDHLHAVTSRSPWPRDRRRTSRRLSPMAMALVMALGSVAVIAYVRSGRRKRPTKILKSFSDRPPTAAEQIAADAAAESVDLERVAAHAEEMNELGANIIGEGQILT